MARRLIARRSSACPNVTIWVQARPRNKWAPSERRSKNFGFDDNRSAAAPIKACAGPAARDSPERPGLRQGLLYQARKRSRLGAA
jgi:hypothetical protein